MKYETIKKYATFLNERVIDAYLGVTGPGDLEVCAEWLHGYSAIDEAYALSNEWICTEHPKLSVFRAYIVRKVGYGVSIPKIDSAWHTAMREQKQLEQVK